MIQYFRGMWFNTHSHSEFCDGKGSLESYIEAGRKLGMKLIGFSGHAPLPFENSWSMKPESFPAYIATIQQLKQLNPDLEIYAGLEVDYIPGIIEPAHFSPRLDYTIGSIHFVDAYENGRPWEIDGQHAGFNAGLEAIFRNDIEQVIRRYFELTQQMINESTPDVVGHLDKIKIQNYQTPRYTESEPWYVEAVMQTLDVIKLRDVIVEINTRGIYQKKSPEPYPSPWIIREMFKQGIRITLNSDAHHPDHLIEDFTTVIPILLEAGYQEIYLPSEKNWKPYPLTIHGIVY